VDGQRKIEEYVTRGRNRKKLGYFRGKNRDEVKVVRRAGSKTVGTSGALASAQVQKNRPTTLKRALMKKRVYVGWRSKSERGAGESIVQDQKPCAVGRQIRGEQHERTLTRGTGQYFLRQRKRKSKIKAKNIRMKY